MVEVGQHGPADVTGQVGAGGGGGGGDEVLRGGDGELVAGPVGVCAGDGGDRVGDRDPQCLADGEQRSPFLVKTGRVARAQHPSPQQGVP